MAGRVVSIQPGVLWTKVALVEHKQKSPKVFHVFYFQTPEHAVEDGFIRDKDTFATALKMELSKRKITDKDVIFTISSSKIIVREVTIPVVKENQIPNIVETQAKDFFPMDVSNFTISYKHMGGRDFDAKTEMKLQLIAVPDNLLTNYVNFAEEKGYSIESIDYIGNTASSYLGRNFNEPQVVVQLEEQTTIISMIEHKKLIFQRVAPYGYMNAVTAVMEHSVLGADNEAAAFEFLMNNDILHEELEPMDFTDHLKNRDSNGKELLLDAQNDIREALSYHLRVVSTALDYYKSQSKEEFYGELHIVGDGVLFAGIKEMFRFEIPLDRSKGNYTLGFHPAKTAQSEMKQMPAETCICVIQAAITPLGIMPKAMRDKAAKKNSLRTAKIALAAAVLISALLILCSSLRQLMAVSEQKTLESQISSLSYIQEVYDENSLASQKANYYRSFDAGTWTNNEQLADLIAALEKNLPVTVRLQGFDIVQSELTLNFVSEDKISAAQLLLNLKTIPLISNLSVPSMTENDNGTWSYSVTAVYLPPQEDTENSGDEVVGTENDNGSAADSDTDSGAANE